MRDWRKDRPLFVGITVFIVVLDQLTKWAISQYVDPRHSIVVIPKILNIVHIRNTGIAFGLFSGINIPHRSLLFLCLTLAAMIVILLFFKKLQPGQIGLVAGLGLVFGGALGNLVDRVRLGEVIDFIDVYIGQYHWPAFNVADSGVTIGALYLLVTMLKKN